MASDWSWQREEKSPEWGLEGHIYTGSPSGSGSKETVGTEGDRGRRRKRATSRQVGLHVRKTTPSEGKGVGGASATRLTHRGSSLHQHLYHQQLIFGRSVSNSEVSGTLLAVGIQEGHNRKKIFALLDPTF